MRVEKPTHGLVQRWVSTALVHRVPTEETSDASRWWPVQRRQRAGSLRFSSSTAPSVVRNSAATLVLSPLAHTHYCNTVLHYTWTNL